MPLPAALAARLAKRGLGLVTDSKIDSTATNGNDEQSIVKVGNKVDTVRKEEEEEVIAENYDDNLDIQEPQTQLGATTKLPQQSLSEEDSNDSFLESSSKRFKGYIYCPNKVNIYHDCSKFCEEHWKDLKKVPDSKYLKRKKAMLAKYPLPSHWKEVYDPGVGSFYYWEVDSDSVSWLPPSHPKAVITEPAAICRQQRDLVSDSEDNEDDSDAKSRSNKDDTSEEESDEEGELERRREIKKRKLEAIEKTRARGRTKLKDNNLDPMDPAAYSDVPRGGWSDGLNRGNEAKTGVDVTASGTLYQMRPYPNPGAVLRANTEHKKPALTSQAKPTVNKPEKPEKGKKR